MQVTAEASLNPQRDENTALYAYLEATGFFRSTHYTSLRDYFPFWTCAVTRCPSIFILAVGTNLLCGDSNIGLGELALKTDGNPPANPDSSRPIITSLCPGVLLPRPPFSLPLSVSCGERWCFPQTYYHFKDVPQNQCTWPRIRAMAEGKTRSDSKCRGKLRHWEAKKYLFAVQPKTGVRIPDPTSKLQRGAKLNRHARAAPQFRPIEEKRGAFTEKSSQWCALSMIQYFVVAHIDLSWITVKSFCWQWNTLNTTSLNWLARAKILI